MQIKETFSQGLKREFEISIPAGDIEKKLIARLETIGKKVKIPGFRPGKVPLNLLKQRYKESALSEVLEECVENGIKQTTKEKNLKLSLKPKINLKSYEEGKDLNFDLKMEIFPTIGEINLDGLSFEKYIVTVPPQSVAKVIENIAKNTRETRPLQKLRKTKKEDIVIIDFEGFIDDLPIEGGSGKAHTLELGSGSFIPGFEDQLIGKEKGNHVIVKLTFPKDYHDAQYAGKPAHFDVTLTDIHEADPITIDAPFAKKIGFDSLEALQEMVEKNIAKDYIDHSFLNTKRHVLDALAERFIFEVPENMVDMEFESIWEQLCHELGIHKDTASNTNTNDSVPTKSFKELSGKNEEELRREYRTIAERRVRLGLLLAEIGQRNKLAVSNQEVLTALMAKAKEYPGQEKEVFDFYRNNESAMASLKAPIFENKIVEFILNLSTVTEKKITPEELEKLLAFEEQEAEKKVATDTEKSKKTKKTKKS